MCRAVRTGEAFGDNPLKFGRKRSKIYTLFSWIPTCTPRCLDLPTALYRVQQASKQARLLQQWWTNSIQSKWGVYWTAIHLFSRGLRLSCYTQQYSRATTNNEVSNILSLITVLIVWELYLVQNKIWKNILLSEPIWTYPNLYVPIWTYLNLSDPIWIYLNLYELIWTYQSQ